MENQVQNIKVLFLHGLESGVQGSKANYLRKNFKEVCVPDLKISVYKLNKQNSILRKLLFNPKNWLSPRMAGLDSLQCCVDIAQQQIKQFNPDIIVGSSMGGAIACSILAGLKEKQFQKGENQWQGSVLLLAPALDYYLQKTWNQSLQEQWKQILAQNLQNSTNRYDIQIYHGDLDDTVPLQNSNDLIKLCPQIKLEILQGGDHRLNSSLIDNNKLKEIIIKQVQEYQQKQGIQQQPK
ncbi:hypothetical protein PPERSA_05852 [Pseudocohnilembus persalinus]|uniref:Serine hydrolase domain-containing protein n=1 Tax=Pseudocohnilembus persalinus TaxID=266149 RepID=A0A0V0R3X8_PSEPJ|nr:hypothetical protein PPERSA_05852 [Pseudocohnilembus persalinus]|eukprot:KRX09183.1 hypothetical protein PPERSA_05852 [Pseudocohnilembus persalinus]